MGDFKRFPKKKFEIFEQCHSAKKFKRGILWDFLSSIKLQNIETNEGETFWCNPKNFKKKSHSAEKNPSEKHQKGILSVFSVFEVRDVGFCFARGSGVSRMFCTAVVQVEVVEQMNKKVDFKRLKKLPTVRVGHIFT